MIINKSVPDISIPFLTGGAAALFASICLPPMPILDTSNLPFYSDDVKKDLKNIAMEYL